MGKQTKTKMTLRRALEIALEAKFDGLASDLDTIEVPEALMILRSKTNNYPGSLTMEAAFSLVEAENRRLRNKEAEEDGPAATQPDDPELPASPYISASWTQKREWK